LWVKFNPGDEPFVSRNEPLVSGGEPDKRRYQWHGSGFSRRKSAWGYAGGVYERDMFVKRDGFSEGLALYANGKWGIANARIRGTEERGIENCALFWTSS
jgi:hypothetical protein